MKPNATYEHSLAKAVSDLRDFKKGKTNWNNDILEGFAVFSLRE
jgi:hypothetical protein